jgi:hypothetical protein
MKRQNQLNIKRGLLSKLVLLVALFLGSSNHVTAEEITVNGGASNTNKYLPTYVEGAQTFLTKSEYIVPSSLIGAMAGKNITKLKYEVSAKATAKGQAEYNVYIEEVATDAYPQSGYDFLKTGSATLVYSGTIDATGDYLIIELQSPFKYSGTKNLLVHFECTSIGEEGAPYFRAKSDWSNYRSIYLKSAEVKERSGVVPRTTFTYEDATLPLMSIDHPDGGDDFGYIKVNTTKTYTVKNIGSGSMDVDITSSDDTYFIASESSLTGITNDGIGKTFDVTFNYNAAYPAPHKANITVTPTFDGAKPEVISVSAGPEVEFDEEVTTTWPTGSGKNVYIKYTSKNGWNTICMPIQLGANIMNNLYGDGWKAYTISSYEENTLYFTKDNYLSTVARPYLVYGKANSPANGFVVEDIMVYNKEAVQDQAAESDAYFRGTYTKKEYNSETDELPANVWYGITNEGKVMKAGTGAYVNGFRAYFTGIEPASTNARVNIVLEDDGETTDLGFVRMVDPEAKDVYTLSGQKVEKAGKGIYIVNGRKVVIK